MEYFKDHSLDIKKYRYWTLALHSNQSYLGRCVCYLNIYKDNLSELDKKEYLELFEIIKEHQKALEKLWTPDLWNYAQLGNVTPHLHLHFIPRYMNSRKFGNVIFEDDRWGENYAPASPKLFQKEMLNEIIDAIKSSM